MYSATIDPASLRDVPGYPGTQAPVDIVLMILSEDVPVNRGRREAERIARSVSGKIVGQDPRGRLYEIQVPTETMEALQHVIERVREEPLVEAAEFNSIANVFD